MGKRLPEAATGYRLVGAGTRMRTPPPFRSRPEAFQQGDDSWCAGFPRHKSITDTISVRRAQVAIRSARFTDTREARAGRKDRP